MNYNIAALGTKYAAQHVPVLSMKNSFSEGPPGDA